MNPKEIEQIINNLGGVRSVIKHCLGDSEYRKNNNITNENIQTIYDLVLAQQSPRMSQMSQMSQSQQVPMNEFKKFKIIITAKEDNNLYFTYLPDIAYFIQYNILLNKWLMLVY